MASPTVSHQQPQPSSGSTPSTMVTSPRIARSPLVSPGTSRSSSQLASLLAETLRENEMLKRELSVSRKNAEKYERIANLTASTSPTDAIPPVGLKRIAEYEQKLERAEVERDEYQARIRIMQDIWGQLDHYLAECEFRAKDAREGFNKIFQDAGGQLQPMTKEQWSIHLPDIPFPNTIPFPSPTYLPTNQQPSRSRPTQRSLHHASTMPIAANNGISLPSFTLPVHPGGASSSRVRPRADSFEGPQYSSNGQPPAKKSRGDALYEARPFSRSPVTSNTAPLHSRQGSSSQPIALHPHQQQIRDDHSRRHREPGHSPRRASSRSSSTSLDEMLLEAANNDGQQAQPGMFTFPQPPQPPIRSPSPSTSHSPVTSRSVFPGQPQGGGLHSYQTHIFAPPVTGAPPVKKSGASASMVNTVSRGGSMAGNAAHHGTHVLGPGGYPPTNAQGQRICRQCGLVGRYKDGKCVEKWGPGPEGPGTVCDKCRKKMKRVERRGTIESQQQREQREQHQQVQQALAHHRSQQHVPPLPNDPAERHSSSGSSSVRRSDTVVVGPGMNYERTSSTRGDEPQPRPSVPALAGLAGPSINRRPPSPPTSNGRRLAPTPPYIATLPNSTSNDEEDERDADRRPHNLSNGNHTPPSRPAAAEDVTRMDVDVEDADGDADGEEDAEADLLEAVDAAEEALAQHKSGTGSPVDESVKLKIEEEI